MTDNSKDMTGHICLVTGANSGLGKATASGLARLGATVVMGCRDRERGQAAQAEIVATSGNEAVDLLIADLSSQQAIRQLVQAFQDKYPHLHVLVNNAGGTFYTQVQTVDGLDYALALNYLAPFLLTQLLLDRLKASAPARIVNVVTRLPAGSKINFDNLQGQQYYSAQGAYSQSKVDLMAITYEMARRWEGSGVTVNCVHPGIFKSNFGRDNAPLLFRILAPIFRLFMADAEQAAERVLYLATSPEVEGLSGRYFAGQEEMQSPKQTYDPAVAQHLWQVSEELTGLA